MKREKSKYKTKKQARITDDKPINIESTYWDKLSDKKSIVFLIILVTGIGTIAFFKYLTTEYLFFFKDIGSDSINQNYPSQVHIYNIMREGLTNKWSFYPGMGRSYVINLLVEPLSWIQLLESRLGMSVIGQDYMIYSKFIRLFIYQFLLTGILFYTYLRTLSFSNFVSVIGSISIAFSGYMVLGSSWGFSGHVFKAVFLLFSFEQL
ncbi:MAG: hypothetical protein HC831_25775, partial [Chloroflexia bacterium]|nr:hypothetical protein [Chloroflexia bacterium]